MQSTEEPVYTQEEAEELIVEAERQASIEEKPTERLLVNIAMATVLSITVFVWGFFA